MILAHIGLMKTASTSIQKLIEDDDRVISRIHWSKYYSSNKVEEIEDTSNKIIFISDENLSREFNKINTLEQSLKNISSYHQVDTILLIIREQFDFLISAYKHHIKQTTDPSDFKTWLDSKAGSSQLKLCDYHELSKKISQVLPNSRLVFVPFEMIKTEERGFLSILYEELKISVRNENLPKSNESFVSDYYYPKLLFNRIQSRINWFNNSLIQRSLIFVFSMIFKKKKFNPLEDLSDMETLSLKVRFQESNKLLAPIAGIDLKKYGYL